MDARVCVYIYVDILVRDTFDYVYVCICEYTAARELYLKDRSMETHLCECV